MSRWALLLCWCACGRIGFSAGPLDGAGVDHDGNSAAHVTIAVTADTSLRQSQPTLNDGSNDTLIASPTDAALVRIDVPSGTQVIAADLHIHTEDVGLASGSAQVFGVLEAWTEAAATYTSRTATATWTDPGCGAPASRAAAPLASFSPASPSTEFVVALPPSVVQRWADTPSSNAGLAIVVTPGGASVAFVSREGDAPSAPSLVITTP